MPNTGTQKKIITLNFNLNDPVEREMYEWYEQRASKVSTYMKYVLFHFMQSQGKIEIHVNISRDSNNQ